MIVGIEAEGEGVLPAVLVDGTILDGTYRVLPLVALLEVGALDDATTWEAEYAGLQVAEGLCQVGTHAVLASFPGVLREHRDMLEVGNHNWFLLVKATQEDAECEVVGSHLGGDFGGVLLPLLALDVDAGRSSLLGFAHRVVVGKPNEQCTLATVGATCPEADAIDGIGLGGNAEEALVLDAGALVNMTGIRKADIMRIALEWAVVAHFDLAKGLPAHQGLRKFERTVLDHLGIETTIGGIVDVLEEDAIHGVLDFSSWLIGLDEQFAGWGRRLIATRGKGHCPKS